MRVLIDTNIILDFLLERDPFFQDAEILFQAIASERLEGYVSATTVTDIFYVARRQTQSIDRARQAISSTLAVLNVCPIDGSTLQAAFASELRDFEDAVQLYCAIAQNLNAIVTRDAQGFSGTTLAVLSVSQLIELLEA
ncbi:MAG TPA: PIN domain-containing protein [Coleofasciculaceae cyanobacterium]